MASCPHLLQPLCHHAFCEMWPELAADARRPVSEMRYFEISGLKIGPLFIGLFRPVSIGGHLASGIRSPPPGHRRNMARTREFTLGTTVAITLGMKTIHAGDRVRFTAPLSNGGQATWTATVVKVEGDIAFVRHPERARTMPFSPVPAKALYKYEASKLRRA